MWNYSNSDSDPYENQPQLDDDNYIDWYRRFRITIGANNHDILRILEGKITAPVASSHESEHDRFRHLQNKATLLLIQFVPHVSRLLSGVDIFEADPKVVWDTLASNYRKSLNIWHIRRQLHGVRLVDYDNALGYYNHILRLIHKYQFAMGEGTEMAADEKAFYYYNGLPLNDESWQNFRLMILGDEMYKHNLDELFRALMQREHRLWDHGEWGRARKRRNVTCFRCKKKGHYKNECRKST